MASKVRCKNGLWGYPEVQCGRRAKEEVINRGARHPLQEGLDL